MKTLADEIYLSEALEALSKCITEADLVNFDDQYCSNEKYMHLPTESIDRLENERLKRIQFLMGGLA
jgi:hypothetical protein